MQVIATFETGGYDAWKSAFDGQSEAWSQAGLTLLQLWRSLDAPDRAVALFECGNRSAAEGWLHRQSALHGAVTTEFLKTA